MIEKPYLANPLLGNNLFVPDVEAHVFEGRLYFYGTYGSSFGKKKEFSQVHVFSTEDFLTYEDHGEAFSIHDIHWAQDTQIWAPDCVYRDGKY